LHGPRSVGHNVSEITADRAFGVSIEMANIGKSPAVGFHGLANVDIAEVTDRASIKKNAETSIRHVREMFAASEKIRADIAPQAPIGVPAWVFNDKVADPKQHWNSTVSLNAGTLERVKRGDIMLAVTGIGTYSDIFGSSH